MTAERREEIARIVDPMAYDQWQRWKPMGQNFNVSAAHIESAREDWERALAKADQIMGLEGESAQCDEAKAWSARCSHVEAALSRLSRAVHRVLAARDAFRSPERNSHPNLVLEEAEAWIELRSALGVGAAPNDR